jgi:hypothetical protein
MRSPRRIPTAELNEPVASRIHVHVRAEDNVIELGRDREVPAGPPSFEELFLDEHDLCTEPCTSSPEALPMRRS